MKRIERGNALVLVIVAIAALVAIAAPFALSMRLHERSARGFAAGVKASEAARAGRELALRRLLEGTPTEERRVAEASGTLDASGEDVDGNDELVPTSTAVPGATEWRLIDPKGVEVAVEVDDEQGKANLNSASGLLLGNLMGASQLALDIEAEAKEIQLEGDVPFFSDGSRETYDGILVIGAELIVYRHIEHVLVQGVERGVVSGLERGAFFSTPDPRMLAHRKGELVQDARGWKLAEHPFWVEMGGYRPYVRVSGMREIASWQIVDLTLANLFRRGVTAEMLASYGLGGETLRALGGGRSFDRATRAPEPKEAVKDVKKDAAARPATATAGAGGEGDAGSKSDPADAEAAADKLAKKLGDGKGDAGAEGTAAVDDALRRMGRKDGTAWLSKVLGAVGGSGTPQSKAFVDQARARMKQLEDHERTYYRGQAEQAARLGDARDLEALSARELERVRPYVCAASVRAGEWAGGALVVNPVDYDPNAGATHLLLGVDVPEAAQGLPCRIDTPDRGPIYRRIAAYVRGGDRRAPQINVFPQLEGSYEAGELRVFVAPAHPVNVNTASRKLLEAILTGIRCDPGQITQTQGASYDFVTPLEAKAVAARLVEAPIDDAQGLVKVLDAAVSASEISGVDRLSILVNALDPGHPRLRARTLPFCFRGAEVAGILSTGIVNDPAGNEVARKSFREVVSIAPPRGSIAHFDSQADFFAGFTDEWQRAGQSLRAGRRGNLMESFPVSLRATNLLRGPLFWPSRSHSIGQGELRLGASELEGDPDWTRSPAVRHFRDEPDGKKLEAGDQLSESSAPVVTGLDLGIVRIPNVMMPGHFEMWFRPTWTDGYHVFFDTGPEGDDRNRIACWYDPDTREVVFEVSDTAVVERELSTSGGRGPRPAELRAPHRFEANHWYHIAACWRGTRQGDLALFIDGRSVGKESHWTWLANDLDTLATRIVVADTSHFPVRGVVRVGSEMIDYDNTGGQWRDGPLGGTVLDAVPEPQIDQSTGQPIPGPNGQPLTQRSSRTGRREHKRGTAVQIAGYTDPLGLRIGDPRSGIQPLIGRIPGGVVTTLPVDTTPPTQIALDWPTPKALVYPAPNQALPNGFLGILAGDTTIPVLGADKPFPSAGVIQIGTERIRYGQVVLVGSRVDQFANCQRGFDGTQATEHFALENVFLCDLRVTPGQQSFDQNNPLAQLSMPGGGDPQPEWVAVRKPIDGSTDRFFLDHGDTRSRDSNGLGRGAQIPAGAPWPTKAQYQSLQPYKALFDAWVGVDLSGARQQGNTPGRIHSTNENVIGVFFTQWGYHGRLDWVTVVEVSDPATRIERRIAWSSGHWAAFTEFVRKEYVFPQARLVKRPSGELPTWTTDEFSIGARRTSGGSGPPGTCEGRIDEIRLARDDKLWGPGADGDQLTKGDNTSAYARTVLRGVAPRWLAEPVPSSGPASLRLRVEALTALIGNVRVSIPRNPNAIASAISIAGGQTGLLVKIDDEVLGAGGGDGGGLSFTERGLLGSKVDWHSAESTPYILPFPPVARLSGGFGGDKGSVIPTSGMRQRELAGNGPGYLALDRGDGAGVAEMLPYDRIERGHFTRPLDDRRRGAYRGGFGTDRDTPLADGRIAILHPFRYFDRFDPTIESDDATYWQATVAAVGAAGGAGCLFETIEWDEERPSTEVGAVIYARIDGKPFWEEKPTNAPGGIFRFDDPRKESRIDVAGRTLEVRVVMPFKPGAFQRNAWKDTVKVGAVRVSYVEGIRTIDSEDLLR